MVKVPGNFACDKIEPMKIAVKIPTKIPPDLYKFFWDTEASKVNPRIHPYYVVNRLLDKGDLKAARWVLRNFPRETIRETFRKIRDFSPWNGTFWTRLLNLKREEVKCLQPHYLAMRKIHWPY